MCTCKRPDWNLSVQSSQCNFFVQCFLEGALLFIRRPGGPLESEERASLQRNPPFAKSTFDIPENNKVLTIFTFGFLRRTCPDLSRPISWSSDLLKNVAMVRNYCSVPNCDATKAEYQMFHTPKGKRMNTYVCLYVCMMLDLLEVFLLHTTTLLAS